MSAFIESLITYDIEKEANSCRSYGGDGWIKHVSDHQRTWRFYREQGCMDVLQDLVDSGLNILRKRKRECRKHFRSSYARNMNILRLQKQVMCHQVFLTHTFDTDRYEFDLEIHCTDGTIFDTEEIVEWLPSPVDIESGIESLGRPVYV